MLFINKTIKNLHIIMITLNYLNTSRLSFSNLIFNIAVKVFI